MITAKTRNRMIATGAAALTMLTVSPAAFSQNIVQRHPTIAGIGAGVATHHMLKASAARKKAQGKKLNFAERHPTLTGIAAGVATHHVIKKTTPHH